MTLNLSTQTDILIDNRLPGLDLGAGTLYPYYAGRSLVNLPSSICRLVGAPDFGAPPLHPDLLGPLAHPRNGAYQHVILILADGMGLALLEAARAAADGLGVPDPWTDLLARAEQAALTSVVPSTTAAALSTLWTGQPPSVHAITGYELWLKEYGMIVNAITHAPIRFVGEPGSMRRAGMNPETFLRLPTLGPHLADHGISPFAYHTHALTHSNLSTMLLPDVTNLGYRTLNELWVSLRANLRDSGEMRTYSYAYLSEIDDLSHRYGPGDERVALEILSFGRALAQLMRMLRDPALADTLVLLIADHGQTLTPPDPRYDLSNHPHLLDCLVMRPSGENRFPYLYLRPGMEEAARAYIQDTWPGEFRIFPSHSLLEAGLLGPGKPSPLALERTGDWIIVPQGSAYWWWGVKENHLVGRHGGLSAAEMLVPLFGFRP